jgi:signal transduction histidine kinase
MREVLDNLLRNAVDATPAGGRVTVGATAASREIALVVRDTGAGIPADVLPKIFDLYFTTKAQGTGVGLAVSQQIVASHGGRIDVESSPGAGTTMRVVLPLQGPGHA